jgi:hypothetical protein
MVIILKLNDCRTKRTAVSHTLYFLCGYNPIFYEFLCNNLYNYWYFTLVFISIFRRENLRVFLKIFCLFMLTLWPVSTPASYSRGLDLKSQFGYRLPRARFLVVFLSPSSK